MKKFFTSESVTEGHPDKICDQISDAILDELLAQDPHSRVACETCCTTGLVLVMGEITTSGYADIPAIVRKTLKEIGDKVSAAEKNDVEAKVNDLKEALKGDNLDAIKSAQDDLQNKFYEVSQKLYQAAQGAQGAQGAQPGQDPNAQQGGNDGYTDADFTEVDDN